MQERGQYVGQLIAQGRGTFGAAHQAQRVVGGPADFPAGGGQPSGQLFLCLQALFGGRPGKGSGQWGNFRDIFILLIEVDQLKNRVSAGAGAVQSLGIPVQFRPQFGGLLRLGLPGFPGLPADDFGGRFQLVQHIPLFGFV